MKRYTISAAALVAIGLASGTAYAHGPYFGGSLGSVSVDTEFDDISFDFDESDSAWSAYAGFELSPSIAIEASYNDFGRFTASNIFGTVLTDVDSEFTGYDIFAKLGVPLGPFDIYGKAGLVFWDSEVTAVVDDGFGSPFLFRNDDNGSDFALGAGAEVWLTDTFSLRGEIEWFDIDDTEVVTFGSVGLSWHF